MHSIALLQQAMLRPLKLIKHVGQTFSSIVGWCWTLFDQCWIVLDAAVFKRIHQCWISIYIRHKSMAYFWSREQKCWTLLDEKAWTKSNFIQHHPTISIVLFKRVNHILCLTQCLTNMFDQFKWTLSCIPSSFQLEVCKLYLILLSNKLKCRKAQNHYPLNLHLYEILAVNNSQIYIIKSLNETTHGYCAQAKLEFKQH